MKVVGVILAGGVGQRFGSSITKQLMSLNGKPVIQWVVDIFRDSKLFDKIIVVSNKKDIDLIQSKIEGIDLIVEGGSIRQESVKIGIDACPKNTGIVIFHDSARPLIQVKDLQNIYENVKDKLAVCSVQPITDSLVNTALDIVLSEENRNAYKLCQTPEAFYYPLLKENYSVETQAVAISSALVERGYTVHILPLSNSNDKITYPQDLFKVEQLITYEEPITFQNDLTNKKILVLGGSGGIGVEIVKYLNNKKAIVYAPTRQELDIANLSLWGFPSKYYQKYDCIIHSAGAYCTDETLFLEKYDEIMDVNFKSILFFLDNPSDFFKAGSSFVIIGSACASYGRKGISLYSASKSAVNAVVEAYSSTLKEKYDINTNVICPAKVGTRLQKAFNPKADLSKMMQPNKVAEIICRYCNVDFTGKIVYIKEGLDNV